MPGWPTRGNWAPSWTKKGRHWRSLTMKSFWKISLQIYAFWSIMLPVIILSKFGSSFFNLYCFVTLEIHELSNIEDIFEKCKGWVMTFLLKNYITPTLIRTFGVASLITLAVLWCQMLYPFSNLIFSTPCPLKRKSFPYSLVKNGTWYTRKCIVHGEKSDFLDSLLRK
jgi:hypothetical protein